MPSDSFSSMLLSTHLALFGEEQDVAVERVIPAIRSYASQSDFFVFLFNDFESALALEVDRFFSFLETCKGFKFCLLVFSQIGEQALATSLPKQFFLRLHLKELQLEPSGANAQQKLAFYLDATIFQPDFGLLFSGKVLECICDTFTQQHLCLQRTKEAFHFLLLEYYYGNRAYSSIDTGTKWKGFLGCLQLFKLIDANWLPFILAVVEVDYCSEALKKIDAYAGIIRAINFLSTEKLKLLFAELAKSSFLSKQFKEAFGLLYTQIEKKKNGTAEGIVLRRGENIESKEIKKEFISIFHQLIGDLLIDESTFLPAIVSSTAGVDALLHANSRAAIIQSMTYPPAASASLFTLTIFRLFCEFGRLVNLHDWFLAFKSTVLATDEECDADKETELM